MCQIDITSYASMYVYAPAYEAQVQVIHGHDMAALNVQESCVHVLCIPIKLLYIPLRQALIHQQRTRS